MKSFDTEVQSKIKETLMNYKKLIKLSLKNSIFFIITWKNMSLNEQVDFARALVFMEKLAKNPKKYFSKSQTNGAWKRRVNRYVAETGTSVKNAYDSVLAPCDVVYEKCEDVLKLSSYDSDYYDFLVSVQNYQYSDQPSHKSLEAYNITNKSKQVKKLLVKKEEDRWFNALLVMTGFNNIQK